MLLLQSSLVSLLQIFMVIVITRMRNIVAFAYAFEIAAFAVAKYRTLIQRGVIKYFGIADTPMFDLFCSAVSTCTFTRGHRCKLYKSRTLTSTRANFYSLELTA